MTNADEVQLRAENSGLWFSPQAPEPRVLGQRGLDSVLFDVRALDPVIAREIRRRSGSHRAVTGSGIIDIKGLVSATETAGPQPALAVPRRATLLSDVAAMPLNIPMRAPEPTPAVAKSRWTGPVLGVLSVLAVALAVLALL